MNERKDETPDQPVESSRKHGFSPARLAGKIFDSVRSKLGASVRSGLRTIERWRIEPVAVPPELKGILTIEMVREAMQYYKNDTTLDAEKLIVTPTPLGNVSYKISTDLVGDYHRRLENVLAIFRIHFGLDVKEMNPDQKYAMNMYCKQLIGTPGALSMSTSRPPFG